MGFVVRVLTDVFLPTQPKQSLTAYSKNNPVLMAFTVRKKVCKRLRDERTTRDHYFRINFSLIICNYLHPGSRSTEKKNMAKKLSRK